MGEELHRRTIMALPAAPATATTTTATHRSRTGAAIIVACMCLAALVLAAVSSASKPEDEMIDFGIPNDKMPASQGGAVKAKLGPAAVGFECRLCTGTEKSYLASLHKRISARSKLIDSSGPNTLISKKDAMKLAAIKKRIQLRAKDTKTSYGMSIPNV